MSQQYQWFRSLTSLIFIYAGSKHLIHAEGVLKRISSSAAYELMQNAWLFRTGILFSGVVMLVAGIALLVGYKPRIAASFLLAMIVPITLLTQLENLNDLGPFFKNVAITGSLLFIIKRKKYETKHSHSDNIDAAFQHGILGPENSVTQKG